MYFISNVPLFIDFIRISTGFFVADSHQMPIYLLRTSLVLFESADRFAMSDELVMYWNLTIITMYEGLSLTLPWMTMFVGVDYFRDSFSVLQLLRAHHYSMLTVRHRNHSQ